MKHKRKGNDIRKLEAFKRLINLCLGIGGLALEVLVFSYYWIRHFSGSLAVRYWWYGYLLQIVIYAVLLLFLSNMYGGLRIGFLKNIEAIFSKLFATLVVNVIIYGQLSLMAMELFRLRFFVQMMLSQGLVVVVWIYVANWIYRLVFPPRRLLLVHGERPILSIRNKFSDRKDKYEIVRCIQVKDGINNICDEIAEGYEKGDYYAVVIWDIPVGYRNQLLKFCYAQSIRFYITPKITDVILRGSEELHLFDTPLLLTRENCLTIEQKALKRILDVALSLLLLLLTSPFMLLTVAAIKLYDGGPVIYKQVRCTEGRRKFYIMKFRSMEPDAEKDGVARLAGKNDSRITPVGRFIRKVRIDELPQLFNILKGDMSFIGPRPERPEIIDQYVEIMPEFVFRMKVKAGLAGYAQIYGKYNTAPYDKLKLDLTYIENYSLWLDFKLILLTLKILFWPDSTEGVETEQVTAFQEEHIRKNLKGERFPKKEEG
ncbi:MAG: exopolysaccharide biosynthesis polyprenyl glycosylphosphotransferase [Clostridium sp.]|nr:exopolysaccharide biosynthesis polyprenyl glycosylphosphotransferase [Clostridium sp.]